MLVVYAVLTVIFIMMGAIFFAREVDPAFAIPLCLVALGGILNFSVRYANHNKMPVYLLAGDMLQNGEISTHCVGGNTTQLPLLCDFINVCITNTNPFIRNFSISITVSIGDILIGMGLLSFLFVTLYLCSDSLYHKLKP
ncbi:MAG: DUF5317 family protein [Patescibacteria group bacterium]|nr:DUF5317 family protein [Patescibacteria group bacterium]MDE2438645.1 DUF5317 family protein [Patescibacteria group bacterium]